MPFKKQHICLPFHKARKRTVVFFCLLFLEYTFPALFSGWPNRICYRFSVAMDTNWSASASWYGIDCSFGSIAT